MTLVQPRCCIVIINVKRWIFLPENKSGTFWQECGFFVKTQSRAVSVCAVPRDHVYRERRDCGVSVCVCLVSKSASGV